MISAMSRHLRGHIPRLDVADRARSSATSEARRARQISVYAGRFQRDEEKAAERSVTEVRSLTDVNNIQVPAAT